MFALNPLSCLESRKTAYCLLALFLWLSASGPCTTNLSLHEVSYQGTDQPELVSLGKCPAPPCLLLYPPTESDSPCFQGHLTLDTGLVITKLEAILYENVYDRKQFWSDFPAVGPWTHHLLSLRLIAQLVRGHGTGTFLMPVRGVRWIW